MKNLLLCLLLLVPASLLPAQQPGVDQDSELLIVPPDDKYLCWHGHPGRTYFLQISIGSDPLVEWLWMPIIDSGTGVPISHEVGGTGPRGFYRLHYTDEVCPPGITLEDWDTDGDWLSNNAEIHIYQTHPLVADTDGDDLSDGQEVNWYATDPLSRDSDGDGLDDYQEILVYSTDPGDADTDEDGLSDGVEVNELFSDPWEEDTDGDGMPDGWEVTHGLDVLDGWDSLGDADSDGVPNGIEHDLRLNPQVVDTDGDTVPDGDEDSDRDGLTNFQEISVHGTSPVLWDDDEDGMPDGWEVANALNPLIAAGADGSHGDPDGDDLSNFDEWLNGTAADKANSDNDPENDGVEVAQGSDPNDAADQGAAPPDKDIVEVPFTVSDPSDSESEKWRMIVKGKGPTDNRTMGLATVDFGATASANLKLRKWNRYEVTIVHLATDPDQPVESNGEPDYDWEATVDASPTTVSQVTTEDSPGVNNFFVAGKYWLVDNREVVFTKEKHGDDENIVDGKKAILMPVAIRDNIESTGVDNDSITADPNSGGYQDKFWIMAQNGGMQFNNDMHFKIHPDPSTVLEMTCPDTAINPASITLAADEPKVNWLGTGSETSDKLPNFKITPANDIVALPIAVKCMKRRTLRLKVFKITEDGAGSGPDTAADLVSTALEIQTYLNDHVFGPQININFQVTMQHTPLKIDWKTAGDPSSWVEVGPPDTNSPDQQLFVDAVSGPNAEFPEESDIVVFLVGATVPLGMDSTGISNRSGKFCWIHGNSAAPAAPDPYDTIGDVVRTIAHEIGHIFVGYGHPDKPLNPGPAELVGTDRSKRLMVSGLGGGATPGVLLVKSEWDAAEAWLKLNIDPLDQ